MRKELGLWLLGSWRKLHRSIWI